MFEEHVLTQRQRELIVAAVRLLDRHGINQFTMRALAEEIGLSPMAAYKHFENQRDLQLEMWRFCIGELGAFLQEEMAKTAESAGPMQRFLDLSQHFMAYSLLHPYRFELLFNHPFIREVWQQQDIDAIREAVWGLAMELVRQGQAAQAIRGDLPPQDIVGQSFALVHGACYLMASERLQRQTHHGTDVLIQQTLESLERILRA